VEVRTEDGTLLVLDCGTGAHDLGQSLAASGERPLRGHLLISHFHWDHIQGFPFFSPLFIPGNEWDVYGPGGMGQQLKSILAGQMNYSYFPITLEEFGATVRYNNLGEGAFDIGGIRITTQYTNHPALTLGFRLEAGGAAVVYIPDHEPNTLFAAGGAPGALPVHRADRRHVEFLKGADLLIHDSQYTLEEYPGKVSWGHSPFEKAVDYAIAGNARRLALFHHDPLRGDAALDRLAEAARRRAQQGARAPEVFPAAEGQVIELPEAGAKELPSIASLPSARLSPASPRRSGTVLIVDDDPFMLKLLERTLEAENGIRLVTAADGETAVELIQKERPVLVLLDWSLPKLDGIEVCRIIRAQGDPGVRDVPILMVTGKRLEENDVVQCFEAGASDYITKKFSPTQLRTRVRGWLLRTTAA